MIRDDITEKLVHLTSGSSREGAQRFTLIFDQQCLKDKTGPTEDGCARISFSETPLSKLGQILAHKHSGIRYQPFGVTVSKKWLFERGGRPVIYQPQQDREL